MQLEDLVKNKQFLSVFLKMHFKNVALGLKEMQVKEVRKHEIYVWQNMIAINKHEYPLVHADIDNFIKKFGIILI